MRPRKSRIFYNGKYFDYPLKALERPEEPRHHRSGPVRGCPTRGPGSGRRRTRRTTRAGSSPASAGASTARSSRPTPRRSGASRSARCPPTGRPSGSRASRSATPSSTRCCPKRNQKDITSLIEEFQYPKYGPGMMWEVCRDKVVAAGLQGRHGDDRSPRSATRTAGPLSVVAEHDGGGTTEYPCTDVISSMPISAAARGHGPAGARRGPGGRRRPALPRLPHRRPRRAGREGVDLDDNWIYIHDPTVAHHAHPELRLVVAVHGQGRAQRARASSTRSGRATTSGRRPTRS